MSHDDPFDSAFDQLFDAQPIMGVFRNLTPEVALARAARAWDAGVRNIEVPVQTVDAMPTLEAVIAAGRERGFAVGAGTIVSGEQLDAVHRAGAAYTVSPGLDADVVRASRERELPHLPGIATASEILAARKLGLRWTKAFPASVLGSGWIKAMLGPFPDQKFVVTGGMNAETAPAFLAAGVRTVAVSDVFDSDDKTAAIRHLLPPHA